IAPSVDGGSLGIYTDNSANRTTQGFQPIREKFKLLHFARKLLPKERTAHCFYNRITKEEGVSVFLNK
ncbi:replication protein, partial [Acinetobacter baumannii]